MTEVVTNLALPERNCRFVNQIDVLRAATEWIQSGPVGNLTAVFGGGPGSGKTSTGVEFAHRVRDYFADGDLYVRFSADPGYTVSESEALEDLLLALGERPDNIPDRLNARQARYRSLTAGRAFLVFLDGVVSAQQVRLLQPGPGASLVVVTESRPVTPADAGRTHLFVVQPLAESAARDVLTGIVGAESITAEPAQATTIIALCDRLPLALSIVGSMICRAQLRTRTPLAETVERLRDEHRRHSVLSTDLVFGAAYRSLPEAVRECYRALGLNAHGGEIGVPALAAAVGRAEYEIDESMIELADAHLVEQLDGKRYGVRELVRRHARDIDDRTATVRAIDEQRLLGYYDRGIAAADALIAPSRPWRGLLFPNVTPDASLFGDATFARAWLRTERRSIMAAAEYAFDTGQNELVVRWCVSLWPFHEKEKQLTDLLALHEFGVLAARDLADPDITSVLHIQRGFAYYWMRELDAAAIEYGSALDEAAGLQLTASALEGLGLVRLAQRQTVAAVELFRRNHEIAREIADPRRITLAVFHRAKAEPAESALELLAQAADGFAQLPGDETENEAKVQFWRGRKLVEQRRFEEAATALAAAQAVMSDRRRPFDEAEIVTVLGDIALGRGEIQQAQTHYSRALTIYTALCFTGLVAETQAKLDLLTDRN